MLIQAIVQGFANAFATWFMQYIAPVAEVVAESGAVG